MIEIQCTSCHTRYRIDERVLPDDTPTFKCSRCGHVFNADPVPARVRKPAPPPAAPPAVESESQPARTIRPARPRPSALKSQVESDVVKREHSGELRPSPIPEPEVRAQPAPVQSEEQPPAVRAVEPYIQREEVPHQPDVDDPLNRSFGDREPQKADTGENLRFDFSDERKDIPDTLPDHEIQRPEPHAGGWQVGEPPEEFERAPVRQAPTMMAESERPAPLPVRRMAAPLQAEAPRFGPPPAPKAGGFQLGEVDDGADAVPSGATHSSGFFLAIFFFVAIVFLAASALISDEPAASVRMLSQAPQIGGYFARPIVPAMLVALHGVRSEYYTLKGGHVALVISGDAQNVGSRQLHLVQIGADLIGDSPRPLASQSVYCGNELSATMLGEMTPREIEFSQGLSPQKTFAMEPSASAPFLMVFIDPPAGAGKLRISVWKAVASDSGAASIPPT
jgi:predicted Zn finger-like uncharacterized protein